jgi:DNA polymerase-2
MSEITGWLLDLYEDGERGLAVWLITEDDRRICLRQPFPVTCYAAGPNPRLRDLWRWLQARRDPPQLPAPSAAICFSPDPIPVLEITVPDPAALHPLFQEIEAAFPDLTYYDVDIAVQVRHAAQYSSFPLARCCLKVKRARPDRSLANARQPLGGNPEPPPLRILEINVPDGDPHR